MGCRIMFVLLATLFTLRPASAKGLADFAGTWNNVIAEGGIISKMVITVSGSGATVEAKADCEPVDCEMYPLRVDVCTPRAGLDRAKHANTVVAVFVIGGSSSEYQLVIMRPKNGRMRVLTMVPVQYGSNFDLTLFETFRRGVAARNVSDSAAD